MRSLRELIVAGADPATVIGDEFLRDIVVSASTTKPEHRAHQAKRQELVLQLMLDEPAAMPHPEHTEHCYRWEIELLLDPLLLDAVILFAPNRDELEQAIADQHKWWTLTVDTLESRLSCKACDAIVPAGDRAVTFEELVMCRACVARVARELDSTGGGKLPPPVALSEHPEDEHRG